MRTSKKYTIALCMIVKGTDDEAKKLSRCLQYVYPHVDKMFITVTQPNEKVLAVAEAYGAQTSYFEWCKDFSKARNFSFSQVPKEYDYILWLDADDALRTPCELRTYLKGADVYVMRYLYWFDENNNPTIVHMKSRIVKNDGCVSWAGRIHEDFKENRPLSVQLLDEPEVLHLSDDERVETAKIRNLEIAEQQIIDEPEDPRSFWNLGNALQATDKHEEALKMFAVFLEKSTSDEEKFIIYLRKADSLSRLNRKEEALDAVRYAIGLRPYYPDGYHQMGKYLMELQRYTEAVQFFRDGFEKKLPTKSILIFNPRAYDYIPMLNLALCYIKLNLPSLALECFKFCSEIMPNDERLKVTIKELQKVTDIFNEILKITERLSKIENNEELKKELDKLDPKYAAHPSICTIRNNRFIKKTSTGRDLSIFCGASVEWSPETAAKKGVGGSEEAVIHLAERLQKRGWNVTVYSSCGAIPKKYGDVWYKPYWMWNTRDKLDVTYIWRVPSYLDYDINSTKVILDLHDVVEEAAILPRLNRIDKIFVKSQFHRSLFPNIPDEKFCVIGNGIDEKVFEQQLDRDPYLLINTSSPDRSLSALCELFPKIKKEVPQARCVWAYGWEIFDAAHSLHPKMLEWKETLKEKMKQAGIEELGRLNHSDVAKLYLQAGVWAYPSEFAEISCISAMKAQAGGAIPVCSKFSALDETVQFGMKVLSDKTIETWAKPYQSDFSMDGEISKKDWVENVVHALKHPEDREEMRAWARKQFSWDNVADKWHEEMMQPKYNLDIIKKWYETGKEITPETSVEPESFDKFPKFPEVIQFLEKVKAKSILDIGCYTGYLVKHLRTQGYIAEGTDIFKQEYDWYHQTNAEEVSKLGKYDAVLLLDVLEHCLDDKKVIKEAEKIAKYIIIHLPRNDLYLDDSNEHLRIYDLKAVHDMFDNKKSVIIKELKDELGRPTTFITYKT